jgi:membrane associated rhomboid family serine protease
MITLIIIITTGIISYMAFNDYNLKLRLMFIPYNVSHNKEYQRILTHTVIHADWTHLIFNMFVLYSFGSGLEMKFSTMPIALPELHFLLLYFGAALFSTIIPFARHKDNPNYMSLGASGCVSAVLFAYICLMPDAPLTFVFFPFFSIPAWGIGLGYLAYEYYMDKRGGSNVAHDAHLGGAVFGIAFMLVFHFNHVKSAILALF